MRVGKENQYARFPLTFYLQKVAFQNDSLVSEFGARRVLDIQDVPKEYGDLTGKVVSVNFRGITVQGKFSKEILPEGAFYNIRFLNVDEEMREQIRNDIADHGFPSPWKRGFPRIGLTNSLEGVEVPNMALVDDANGVHYFRVLNFTLGGLLLQTDGETAEKFAINERFYTQLITSNGDSISGVWCAIVRKDLELTDVELKVNCGVQIISMSSAANKIYRRLILNYCEQMKKHYNA